MPDTAVVIPLAVVTGGQQGIGEAIARALACSGHDVVIADLSTSASQFRERWACEQPSRLVHSVLMIKP